MKKEFFATTIILALIAGSVVNIFHIKALTKDITVQVTTAQTCCRRGDYDSAEQALRDGLDIWLSDEGYTHIFIRHSEIDGTSDAFYEALSAISEQDGEGAVNACEKLQYHIDSIVSMECVTIKSVF